MVRDFDEGTTPRLASGRVLREWELVAHEKEIEVAPGVAFAAWTYNGRVPGPALRAREGERLRIRFRNATHHPHTIHFHGIHPSDMDGVPGPGAGLIQPGGTTVYEFDAEPFGLHLYHCHASPLAAHITKGLYGAFLIDPKEGRPDADELVMVMNGFDTNFDRSNEFYAANSIPFAYMDEPIAVARDALVRLYLVNVLEYDLINSFHLHGNLFNYFPTGHVAAAERADGHRHAVPGPARDPRDALPAPREVHVPRPPVRVHRARLDGHLRRLRRQQRQARLRPPGGALMEAHADSRPLTRRRSLPAWLLGLVPLLLAVGVLGAFAVLGGPGLGDRPGPPVEELSVERTVLEPGSIKLTVRNDGPDPVTLAQAFVNDAYVDFDVAHAEVDRLRAETVHIAYPWIEGEAYEVGLLTSTGATFTHEIAAAVETPSADLGFFGLMALLGIYVGVIPVALGMLWLPFVRRVDATWIRVLLAATVGLLGFLAVDATLEALEIAGQGAQALGGAGLVALGAGLAYLTLAAVSSGVSARAAKAGAAGASPLRLAGLVALGIGLHNLGEGLAIGSAYATGALALGAFLVVGFAIHNTTEGLAIVAPLGRSGARASVGRLAVLGLLAGGPAVLGAWIGAAAFTPSLAAFLLGVGVGAIAQVIVQIAPGLRDAAGRILDRAVAGGIAGGMLAMYATGLLVSA